MSRQDISYHYSKALFNLTKSSEELLRQLPEDLNQTAALVNSVPKLRYFLNHPKIELAVKEQILQRCLQKSLHPLLLRFVFFLMHKNRLPYLLQIAREYQHLAVESLGILEVTAVTAVPMAPQTRDALKDKIFHFYRRPVVIKEKIDAQIIGGVILFFAHHVIDWSIKTRLARLEKGLLSHKV